jgi:hypothetical protein
MTDTQILPGGLAVPAEARIARDATLRGDGSGLAPLGLALTISAQVRITATIDGEGGITFTAEEIATSGGVTFGGLDQSLVPTLYALRVILTLPRAIPDADKIPIVGLHFPSLPPTPFLNAVFLGIPPIPFQDGDGSTDASLLVNLFAGGVPDTVEVIDVTYALLLVNRA